MFNAAGASEDAGHYDNSVVGRGDRHEGCDRGRHTAGEPTATAREPDKRDEADALPVEVA